MKKHFAIFFVIILCVMVMPAINLAQTKSNTPSKTSTSPTPSEKQEASDLRRLERYQRKEHRREHKVEHRTEHKQTKTTTTAHHASDPHSHDPAVPRQASDPVDLTGHKKQINGHQVTVVDVDPKK